MTGWVGLNFGSDLLMQLQAALVKLEVGAHGRAVRTATSTLERLRHAGLQGLDFFKRGNFGIAAHSRVPRAQQRRRTSA